MTNKTVLSDQEWIQRGGEEQFFLYCDEDEFLQIARFVERIVLQSPEIQQLRKDAERYRWLLGNYAFGDGYERVDYALNSGEAETLLSNSIDEAMEIEP